MKTIGPARRAAALDLIEVVTWSPERLEASLRCAHGPDPDLIAGWEWNGYNVPFVTRLLGFRKFKKGFLPAGDLLCGYNVKVQQQGGPLDSWVPVHDASGKPVHHGFFDVHTPVAPDDAYPNALLIDYDCGRNPTGDPSGLLRDYLVALGPHTLLGKAYAALGSLRIPISYFVLQRAAPVSR